MPKTIIEGPLIKSDSRFAMTHDMSLLVPLPCCSAFPSSHECFIFFILILFIVQVLV